MFLLVWQGTQFLFQLLIHCADLNGSVVQVGRVSRQFHDAIIQVRQLRQQVKEIQGTLGAGKAPSQSAIGVLLVVGIKACFREVSSIKSRP